MNLNITLIAILVLGFGCKNVDKNGPSLTTYSDSSRPEDLVMANKEHRPLWTDDLKGWQKERGEKGKMYFVGGVERRASRSTAIEEAKLEAQVNISNSIASVVTETMAKTQTGPTVVSPGASKTEIFEFVQRRLGRKTKNAVSGIEQADDFWWERKDTNGGGNFFDAWVLYSMDERAFKTALNTAVMEIMPASRNGKKATEEVIKELQQNETAN